MTATAPSRVYGYGYDPTTAGGWLPYSYNYDKDYDYPIPDEADPRWRLKPLYPSQSPEVAARPEPFIVTTRENTPQYRRPAPPRPLWLLLGGLALLLMLVFVALAPV